MVRICVGFAIVAAEGAWSGAFEGIVKVENVSFLKTLVLDTRTMFVNVYKLNPSRIYATYFGGNKSQNLDADDEARSLWLLYLVIANMPTALFSRFDLLSVPSTRHYKGL